MANQNFFDSKDVRLFPNAYRGFKEEGVIYNPESRLPSEYNITDMIKSFGYDSFIINWDESNKNLKVVIKGYLFDIDIPEDVYNNIPETDGNGLWFKVKIDARNNNPTGIEENIDYGDISLLSLENVNNEDNSTSATNNEYLDSNTKFVGLEWSYTSFNITSLTEYQLQVFDKKEIYKPSLLKISSEVISNKGTLSSINEKFNTNTLSASSITTNTLTTNNSLVAYGNGIITQSIFGPSGLFVGTSGILSLYAISIHTQGDILPYASGVYNLGSIGSRFQSLYVKYISNPGDMAITANTNIAGAGNNGVLNLNAGSYISLNGNTNTHSIYPNATNTYNLGSSNKYYKNAYLSAIYGLSGSITLNTDALYIGSGDFHDIYFGSDSSEACIGLDSEYPGNDLTIYRGKEGGINLNANGNITLNTSKSVNLNPGSNYSIYLNAGKDFVHLVNDGPVGNSQTPIYLDASGKPSPISYKIESGHKELSFSDSRFNSTAFGKANSNSECTSITSWNSCYNSNATLYLTYQRIGNILNIDLKLQKTSTTAFLYSEDDWIRISKAWLCYIVFGNYITTPANSLNDTCVVSLLENNAYGYGEHFINYIDNNYIYICLTQKHSDASSNDGICAHISLILN